MKPLTCKETEKRLWRYVDRELTAAEITATSRHLEGCETCRGLYHDYAREAGWYGEALRGLPYGEPLIEKCLSKLKQERRLDDAALAVPARLRSRRFVLASAAALLVVGPLVALLVVSSVRSRSVGSFEVVGVPVTMGQLDEAGRPQLREGDVARGECSSGDVFRVAADSRVELRFQAADGTLLSACSVKGPALFWLPSGVERGRILLRLQEGLVEARVVPLGRRQSFAVDTPQARAAVVGTEFRLQVTADATYLRVIEGVVRFESATWREPQGRGRRLLEQRDGEWVVRRSGPGPERVDDGRDAAGSGDAQAARADSRASIPEPESAGDGSLQPSAAYEGSGKEQPVGVPPEVKETLDQTVRPPR